MKSKSGSLSYKELAEISREVGGRAPKFDVKYFTKKEVKDALERNGYFTHVCVELGLMRKGSKSPFNAIRNLHKLIAHFKLSSNILGSKIRDKGMVKCPYCRREFKKDLENSK